MLSPCVNQGLVFKITVAFACALTLFAAASKISDRRTNRAASDEEHKQMIDNNANNLCNGFVVSCYYPNKRLISNYSKVLVKFFGYGIHFSASEFSIRLKFLRSP